MNDDEIRARLKEAYFSAEHHERAILDRLPALLAEARTFVDVGASLGQYAHAASQIMQGGDVLAIEPDPVRYELLAANLEAWRGSSTCRLRGLQAAVSDRAGTTRFFTSGSVVSGGLFTHDVSRGAAEWREIEVDVVRLDDLFPDRPPDFIKIDVEGSELRVLEGAARILAHGKTRVLIEIHGWADPERQVGRRHVFVHMLRLGYLPAYLGGNFLFSRPDGVLAKQVVVGMPALVRKVFEHLARSR